jgi:hypothetical protein
MPLQIFIESNASVNAFISACLLRRKQAMIFCIRIFMFLWRTVKTYKKRGAVYPLQYSAP